MKFSLKIIINFFILSLFFSSQDVEAQFLKKLKKRAEKAAEEAVIRKTEEKVYKETSKKMDTVLGNKGPNNKNKTNKPNTPSDKNPTQNPNGDGQNQDGDGEIKDLKVYSKFDFVPGDKLLFFDDFSNDFIGDFPSKWNTNGGGELVTIGDSSQKWLGILPGYNTYYVPDVTLPEEYTIEFDLYTKGLDKQTSSVAVLQVMLSDNNSFSDGDNYFHANIPFCQYAPIGFRVKNYVRGAGSEINNVVKADIRQAVLSQPHISIAVNKQRFRLWVNEKKYVDIPRAIPLNAINSLKFELHQFKDGKERLFISNLKVAEGGVDLRRKLIEEGLVSTNGILFDSGSANIQSQSYGIIRQISQVLKQETAMRLNIIGHTDADGSDEANMTLSKNRAEAVKNALINIYDISGDRLQTEGKGESEPVGDNATTDGKAQNRRVVFVKI